MARYADAGTVLADSGPSIRGIEIQKREDGSAKGLLSESQRQRLAAVASVVSVPARTIVYREEAELSWIFISSVGVLKAYRELPSGKRRVASFLFPGDVFGLAENGHYINTVQTITNAMLYRIPNEALTAMLRRDGDLQFQFLSFVSDSSQIRFTIVQPGI